MIDERCSIPYCRAIAPCFGMSSLLPLSASQAAALAMYVGLVFLGYYNTMFHESVGGGDSGELVATACTQSPSHPPGYPLLLMLNGAALRFAAPFLTKVSFHEEGKTSSARRHI